MTGAMAWSWSLPWRLMSLTPCALRPVIRMCSTPVRTIWPPTVMSMISSFDFTAKAPQTSPVLAVVFMVMMPLPPRVCVRYSSNSVRLPTPFSPATNSVASLATMAAATRRSFLPRRMPRTPAAVRPIERTFSSLNRMLLPSLVISTTSSWPVVSLTVMRRSPSLMPMALMPVRRTLA